MYSCADVAQLLLRQHNAKSELLRPIEAIAEKSWLILLKIYFSEYIGNDEVVAHANDLGVKDRNAARYIRILETEGYIVRALQFNPENTYIISLTPKTKVKIEQLLFQMAQEALSSLGH